MFTITRFPIVNLCCKISLWLLAFTSIITVQPLVAQVAILTYHNDNSRTGQSTSETILTPSNVNVSSFGKLASCDITPNGGGSNAYVYAQPLYVPNVSIGGTSHNVIYVATEREQVFAF